MSSSYSGSEGLAVAVDGPVLRIRFDRPERHNALTDDTVAATIAAIERASEDDEVRVIALSGSGADFCSGFDLGTRGRPAVKPRTGATQRQLRNGVNRLVTTMLETQTPIVAAATGHVIGLGVALLLVSDFAVVADDAACARRSRPWASLPTRARRGCCRGSSASRGEGVTAARPRDQRRAGCGVGARVALGSGCGRRGRRRGAGRGVGDAARPLRSGWPSCSCTAA